MHDTPTRSATERSRSTVGLHVLLAIVVLATVSRADAQEGSPAAWMKRAEILEAFVESQLSGVYPNGTPWTERVRRDGTSDYREGASRREGRWWMSGDHFCFAYARPQSGGCFQVVQVGSNCFELYAVGTGGSAQAPPVRTPRSWNGRMWREDKPATCQEMPIM